MLMKESRPCLGIPGRSENYRHFLFRDYPHYCLRLGIKQRHIHSERLVRSLLALADMLLQGLRMHGSRTYQAEPSAITYGGSQSPTTAPYHTSGDYGITYAEQFTYTVHKRHQNNTFVILLTTDSIKISAR